MIRHPLHSAVGRTRPDLNRVADGIAASLRQFSFSAGRSADDQPQRPTGRQRAAAAVDELIATAESSTSSAKQTLATSSGSRPQGSSQSSSSDTARPPPRSQGPNIITLKNISRGAPDSGNGGIANLIRGGFLGRGRGRGGGSFAPSAGRGGFAGRGRGGARAGGNRDDRPRRSRRGGARGRRGRDEDGEGGGRRGRGRGRDNQGDEGQARIGSDPEVKAYLAQKETGETIAFNPSVSLAELAGWGPAMATSATPFAQGETVMRQARILGGGQNFHPTYLENQHEMRVAWRDGPGVFVPPSEDAKVWAKQVLGDREVKAPEEIKTAVLEDALLGKYEGPKYTDPSDTLATVRNYAKRDGTWNAGAERSIEAKVRSLLGPSAAPAAAKAGAAKARPKA
ncbi:hypothetical protein F5Y04DRAFT_236740 [Hypomontagnella monticulosa]|nr:hypothetical protein F5Y04DRAFT_236740 [Hypomontagnella monticulosa]